MQIGLTIAAVVVLEALAVTLATKVRRARKLAEREREQRLERQPHVVKDADVSSRPAGEVRDELEREGWTWLGDGVFVRRAA